MRVLIAPDKFKGTLDAVGVAAAVSDAVVAAGHQSSVQVLADGGEGTLEAFGGANRVSQVSGPLGDPVDARWRLDRRVAVIEMAEASGLSLVGGAEGNDPLAASTAGTGELIDLAIARGAKRVVIGVGGSATTDGGWGAVQALHPVQRLRGVELLVACDVRTLFVDAAEVFGPQKGASVPQVEFLRRRLVRLVQVYEEERGVDVGGLLRSGAAGGLAGGLASLGAELCDGFELVSEAVDLYGQIEAADLVITGEGRVDRTSLAGKVVGGVIELAADAGVPVVVVAGSVDRDVELPVPAFSLVEAVGEAEAMSQTAEALTQVAGEALASLS